MEKIRKKILDAAKKKGKNQRELCDELGVSQTGFKQMFDNGSVKYSILLRISEILEEPLNAIITDNGASKVTSDVFAQKLIDQYEKQIDKLERDKATLESNNHLLQELVRKEYLGKRKGLTNTGTMQIAA